MKARKWKTLDAECVYHTPIFDLHRKHREHPTRGRRHFYVLDAPAWVNIIPLTARREVVMVRQWRHGIDDFTLEIPGGMVDPGDESPLVAARREMREETGFDSADIVALGEVHPNPAIQPNICYSYLARSVRKAGPPRLDSAEETEVIKHPISAIKNFIANGTIMHALTIAAFSFYFLYRPPRD